ARSNRDWSSDVCSSDLDLGGGGDLGGGEHVLVQDRAGGGGEHLGEDLVVRVLQVEDHREVVDHLHLVQVRQQRGRPVRVRDVDRAEERRVGNAGRERVG